MHACWQWRRLDSATYSGDIPRPSVSRSTYTGTLWTDVIAAGAAAMIRSGLQVVDAQAKLAQSLGTTVESIQVLERAGELAGVSMSGIEQATKDLTRRLSQAAAGTGPAVAALERLGLSASALLALPLDERVGRINQAIEDFVPAAGAFQLRIVWQLYVMPAVGI